LAEAEDMNLRGVTALTFAVLALGAVAEAQVTYTNTTSADAFLATGSPSDPYGTDLTGLNYGAAGTLAISPPLALEGEFQSVVRFDVSGAPSLFDATYGTNNWSVASILLQLTSNYGTQGQQPNNRIFNVISGGQFVIEWLSDTNWVEGTGTPIMPETDGLAVTYTSLPSLLAGAHEILCTNTYVPAGTNVPVIYALPFDTNLISAVTSGGSISLLFYAGDNQIGYLFNSHEYGRGNEPLIEVTASPVFKILSGYSTNAAFHLSGFGPTNLQYNVQVISSLTATNWQTIGTTTPDATGNIQFIDTNAVGHNQRFYRLSL
jgi:hypothetical protein